MRGSQVRKHSHWPTQAARVFAFLSVLISSLASAFPANALTVEEITSSKGVRAWLVEEHAVPLIAINFAFVGGAVQDPPDKEGMAGLLADLMQEGAGDLSAAAFKERLSGLGARLSTSNARDAIYGSIETLSARFKPSAELLRLALVAPRFDAEAVERVRSQRLNSIALDASNPVKVANEKWYAEAFAGHPYGRPVDGTPQSLAGIAREDISAHYAKILAKNVLRVVIVGDIDKRAAAEALDEIFGGLPETAGITPATRTEPKAVGAPVVVSKDQPLAVASFGLASLAPNHPDFAALEVLNHIIGSGDFDSRLTEEIRVKRGLAYAIQTTLARDSIASLIIGGVSTKNEAMGPALAVLKDVLASTARDGPESAKFENAKRYLVGSFLLDFDTNGKVANSLLSAWLDGEGRDYLQKRNQKISAVTLADVKRVAKDVFQADRLIVTIVGKPKLEP